MISGAQTVPGVIANADDYVLNQQELDRGDISSVADPRTMFELYYRGYAGAIAGGVGSFMCSYNVRARRAPAAPRAPRLRALNRVSLLPSFRPHLAHQWHACLRE
jgi:hypothetical protein